MTGKQYNDSSTSKQYNDSSTSKQYNDTGYTTILPPKSYSQVKVSVPCLRLDPVQNQEPL